MSIMTADEIRDSDEDELKERMNDMKKQIVEERGQIETGGFADNPGKIKEMRRTIARIKTILNERSSK